MTSLNVLFVGDEPSKKNTNPAIAFEGTKSGVRLREWADFLNITHYQAINQTDDHFEKILMDYFMAGFEIIALGRNAENKIKKTGVPYFHLPHPSGKNRQLNNKNHVLQILTKLRKELHNVA